MTSLPVSVGVNDGSWLDKTGPRKGKRSKEELEMEKQEKEAVKKYLEQERKVRRYHSWVTHIPFKGGRGTQSGVSPFAAQATFVDVLTSPLLLHRSACLQRQEESRRRAVAGQAKNPVGNKKNDKEAPWATKTPAPGQPQPNKPKAPKPRTSFQQVGPQTHTLAETLHCAGSTLQGPGLTPSACVYACGCEQISLTTRQFSIDDVQSLSFEGSHLEDVPYLGLPEVAVFGRSNVGKSSLLNCLAGTNKGVAVVSKTPGRTQVYTTSRRLLSYALLPPLSRHVANVCIDLAPVIVCVW